ncbi:substrate-binding domain-containing protein [Microbacterium aoyamense]|uniref:Substrate-binding domain-containing protein n=1 Tax=Microbacterium aoyamense TaxID=344166 RepID=A0ABP5BBB9_9MICO|nr:substrate-binding domain-containing protein [Microbacterium aoyamense]
MTRTTKIALAVFAAAALGVGVAGCTATPDGGGGAAGEGDIVSLVQADDVQPYEDALGSLGEPEVPDGTKICYVTRTLSNEYWSLVADGVENRAKELGAEVQIFAVNDEASITEQLDKAKSALTQGCTVLLASPISATGLDSVFTDALAQGVPAIVLNDAKGTLPGVVYSGPDSLTTGRTAADYLAEQLPDGGKVAMVEGDPGSSNALNRGQGFEDGLAEHPNLELVAAQTANWDQTKAQDIATAMLTANPDLKAFYVQNDGMALGVATAVERAGKTGEVLIVGTDGIPQAKTEIQNGRITATVSQKPNQEGAAGVDVGLWLLAGKEVPGWIEVPAFIIDSANVADYAEGMP